MKLSTFVLVEEPTNRSAVLILSTTPPFHYGHLWKFQTAKQEDDFDKSGPFVKIEGYRMYITPSGSLLPMGNENAAEILSRMADFFFTYRVKAHEPRFRRFAE